MEAKKNPRDFTTEEFARTAMQAALDKKATDVIALNVAPFLSVTDYFILATGANERQIASIADEIEDRLVEAYHLKPIGREGKGTSPWVLLDFGDIVVHVFQPDTREEYRLDKLWSEAKRLKVEE
ncbi:MAG: ribosome silencing factor [Coriobacteriia bacterium]|nr:ribosome silencing factor [Coriobacteriia bacterium]